MAEYDHMRYERLARKMLRDRRFHHSLSVRDEAVRLAQRFGADVEKARVAGMLHDITKEHSEREQLRLIEKFGITLEEEERHLPKIWHAITASAFLERELGIHDREILDAVRYHTTGHWGMTTLEKVIYLADCVEPLRDYPGVEQIRAALDRGLDAAMVTAVSGIMRTLLATGRIISSDSFAVRNDLLLRQERA